LQIGLNASANDNKYFAQSVADILLNKLYKE